jgi:septal ring factor EnvC (AmiA/AmiB activator)
MQFLEKQKSPEDAEQAVGVPKRKGDAEADIANGINRQRVGNRPHASSEYRPHNQVRSLANVMAHVRRAADKRRYAPARQKNSEHHDERNSNGRNLRINQLDGGFGAAEPGSGGEPAENSQGLEAAKTLDCDMIALGCGSFHAGRC